MLKPVVHTLRAESAMGFPLTTTSRGHDSLVVSALSADQSSVLGFVLHTRLMVFASLRTTLASTQTHELTGRFQPQRMDWIRDYGTWFKQT